MSGPASGLALLDLAVLVLVVLVLVGPRARGSSCSWVLVLVRHASGAFGGQARADIIALVDSRGPPSSEFRCGVLAGFGSPWSSTGTTTRRPRRRSPAVSLRTPAAVAA